MRQNPTRLLMLIALLLGTVPAGAAVNLTLSPAALSGVGSNTVVFAGSFTNTSTASNVFLNQIQFTFTGTATNYLTADTNSFYANVPGILLPLENYVDAIFAINLGSATPPGSYAGTATVLGGTNIFATNLLDSQPFQVLLSTTCLNIQRSSNSLVLSWPFPPANFTVQQVTSLLQTNWVTLTNVPVITNGIARVVLPLAATNNFFRLSYP